MTRSTRPGTWRRRGSWQIRSRFPPPLSTYSALGGLPQAPGCAAQSPAVAERPAETGVWDLGLSGARGNSLIDVIVVGCGPTGLMLAAELRLRGRHVVVLER